MGLMGIGIFVVARFNCESELSKVCESEIDRHREGEHIHELTEINVNFWDWS